MKWWQNIVVYQIYPRSFQDANGDGIGDLQGIIKRLDYLSELGINAIWLGPVYQSPNDDNGYDISDYKAIHREYGTMADMDELILEANKRNIKIIMDLVVNHTSDEHEWFVEAQKGKNNPYRDYYIWRDPVDGNEPNDLKSVFSGSAWEYDEKSDQYFLHLYSKKQPDLNWENEEMRYKIYDMMNFWLNKGIGGFRLDVIDNIGKVPDEGIVANGPKLHDYLHEMNRETFGNYDVLTVGETWSATPEDAALYSDPERKELSMIFQFEHIGLDEQPGKSKWDLKPLDIQELKKVLAKWQTELSKNSWNSLYWNNHDTPRIVSRWGNDKKFRVESAKMFAIILHLMQGTPYIYQGEEIGMTNRKIEDISEAEDIESINIFHERINQGYDPKDILESINTKGRDNARTPMQWSTKPNAGFTVGTPWLEVNPNYKEINVEAALNDSDSIFYTYKQLIQMRKKYPIIVEGSFQLMFLDHPSLFAYERELNGEKWLIAANMTEKTIEVEASGEPEELETIIGNYNKKSYNLNQLILRPYETFAALRVQ